MPTDFIAACLPGELGGLAGDKAVSVVFDNTKSSASFPAMRHHAVRRGVRQTLAWFDADPARKQIDAEANATWDKLIDAYERAPAKQCAVSGLKKRPLKNAPRGKKSRDDSRLCRPDGPRHGAYRSRDHRERSRRD